MAITDSDSTDGLVRYAAPPVRWDEDGVLGNVLRDLATEVISTSPAGPSRGRRSVLTRRRRRLWAVPLAAGVLSLTAAAGFAIWHDSASPDFARALDDYSAQLPLPPENGPGRVRRPGA